MARFLLPACDWPAEGAGPALLRGDEARHLSQVLRIRTGESITVFDGAGRRASAEVLGSSRHEVRLEIENPVLSTPPRPRITLAQAIPKGKTMDWIVQKAVELGVARIQPLITRHTIVQAEAGKEAKWQRTALEACKQCGQDFLPEISPVRDFASWLTGENQPAELPILASLAPGARPLRQILHDHPGSREVSLLVGPEGDFHPEETAAALQAGYQAASLGSIILRVETAAMFCLSALRCEFGE